MIAMLIGLLWSMLSVTTATDATPVIYCQDQTLRTEPASANDGWLAYCTDTH